jgi:hypothetical protein
MKIGVGYFTHGSCLEQILRLVLCKKKRPKAGQSNLNSYFSST